MTNAQELEKLAKAATPGPWFQCGSPWFSDGSGVLAGSPDPHVGVLIVDTENWTGAREEAADGYAGQLADPDADAAFIAAANPAAILSLLSDLRAAREQAKAAEGRAEDYRTVAINQGWNWTMCDAYGREAYAIHRGEHVDACALNAAETRARLAASDGEGVS